LNVSAFRPAEVRVLMGDYSKAKARLGWEPTVRFKELVTMMVDADVEGTRPTGKGSIA